MSQLSSREKPLRRLYRSPPMPMMLEPRIMFDGAAVDTANAVVDGAVHDAHIPAAVEPPAPSAPGEIVFVDERVPEYQQLVTGSRPDAQIVVVHADQDGLAVIDATLAGRTDIASIHLVTHGAPGEFELGNTAINTSTLAARADQISAWSDHLASSADVLLYGCNVAASGEGRALVERLGTLSGADIAASIDDTGGASAGGDWELEYRTGSVATTSFLTASAASDYANRLSQISLNGSTGWTAVMFGANRDPVGDSQAGAADTDIVGDANHGSLYVAFDDNGSAATSDDNLAFRLRIDNPTSNTYFGGVAVVGLDANLDGRVDVFMSVDGRNNGLAVKLLDPGTGANISPSTTSTQPLPTGWLPNNGVYPFSAANYAVVAASALTDPHWNGDNDLGNDGKTDVFVNWRIPLNDLAIVLAKPSAVDRNGNYGPRGAAGIGGFTQNTAVQYINFTQTQTGPINGDLNGVGSSYDRNATFAALGAFTVPMSAANPIASGPTLELDVPAGGSSGADGVWSGTEDGSITISGGSANLAQGTLVTVRVADGSITRTATGTVQNDGTWSATFSGGQAISGLADGALSIEATADPDNNAGTNNDIFAVANILHDRTPPTVGIDQLASAISGTPTFTGTSDLPDGSLITVTLDADNNAATTNLVYQVLVSGGVWSLNTATITPVSGTVPAGGFASFTKVSATATDAAGNTATAIALNRPTVTPLSTNNTAPVISGTWTQTGGDVLTITVSGATYTLSPSGNSWSVNLATATPSSGSLTPLVAGNVYSVTATVTRGGANVSDTTSSELTITTTPVKAIDISGGATANGTDTTPTISGTSANAGGFVIVRLDPGNDGNLADAVTYSVVTDGSGNWSLDTGSATPIAGTVPVGGYIGAIGVLATDSSGAVSDVQVLTVTTPSIAVGAIASAASADAFGQISNSGAGANFLNATEDNNVTISGTASNGFTVNLLIADANGNAVTVNNIAVNSGAWSTTGVDLSNLDNGTLSVRATLSGTGLSSTDTSVTHDKTPNQIFITNQTTIPKSQATLSGSSTLGSGVSLTVTVRDSTDTTTVWTGTTTTSANGDWTVTTPNGTNLVSGNSGNVIIKVAPTTTNTDAAGNITQQIVRNPQAVQNGAANSSDTISIGTIATDSIITADEITSGLTITGTTNLTTAATSAFTVTVSDGTVTQTATIVSNVSGTWTATLTQAQVQGLKNGQLVVTARVTNTTSGIAVSDVELPTLSLATPTLVITDDTPATATGPVTFTFTFSESMTGFTTGDVTVTGGTKGTFSGSGTTYTLVVTPTASSSGNITVSVASSVANGANSGRGNAAASSTQPYNTTGAAAPPTLTVDADDLAVDPRPLITGITNLAAGAPVVLTIDPDNDSATSNSLTYSATVQSDGSWSVDVSSATPTAGVLPADGLPTYARVTATATNAYGNSTSVIALDKPAVIAQVTNDSTPTIHGTWTNIAGDALSVTVAPSSGGSGVTYTVGSGLVVAGNTWSIDSGSLTDGTYNVTAETTRGGTTKTDVTSSELVIDTLATVDITGGATRDTNDPTPVISGTTTGIAAGTVLTLRLDTDNDGSYELVYRTTVQAGGAWSIDTTHAIAFSGSFPANGLNGNVPMEASATDSAGNVASDAQTLNVDVTAPSIGITSGTRTPDSTPLITGTTDLAPLSTITLNIDPNNDGDWSDQQTYTTSVQTNGTWSVQTTLPLSGTVAVRASGTDAVGNTATIEAPLIIDLSAPTIAVVPVATANNDFTADSTEDDAVTISGTSTGVADGETIQVTITDGTITISDTAIVSGGAWQLAPLNLSALANGTIAVAANFVDGGGNGYPATTDFQHDKSATVAIDSISEDTGAVADFTTKDSTVSILGSATPGASVDVEIRDSTSAIVATFSVAADGAGAWSTASTSALNPGQYTITASVGATSVNRAMTIVDATSPALIASSPADNAVSFAIADNLALTFNRTVAAGFGTIRLYRADGTLLETFDVVSGAGDHSGTVSIGGSSVITLNPGQDLVLATSYYIQIDSTAVIDSAGNAFTGIADNTTLNFATGSGVSAPSQVALIVSMTLDTGASANDFITSNGSAGRTVAGTLSAGLGAGEIVEVSFDGGASWSTATTVGTNWSIVDNNSYSADWTLTARVTSTISSLSGSATTQAVTLDSTAPGVPTVNSLLTTSTAPILTGTAVVNAGETLTVAVNGATYILVPVSGAWTLDLASATPSSGALGALVVGSSYAVTARVVDLAGNSSADVTTNELTIAATGPTQTPSIVSMTNDSGVSATDFITADGSAGRTVFGALASTLVAGEVVEVSFDGGSTWMTATTSGASWSAVDPASHSSDWTLQARVTNTMTLVSGPAAQQAVSFDATAPGLPAVTPLTTTSTLPTLTGTAAVAAGETLSVTVNGATYLVAPQNGTWILNLATATPASGALGAFLPGTAYSVTATITDLAGNAATDITTGELTIALPTQPTPTQIVTIASMTQDTGVSATDFITNDGTAGRVVAGTLSAALGANEALEVSFDGGTTWVPGTVIGMSWSAVDSLAHSRDWIVLARVANLLTSAAGPVARQSVILDNVAPVVPTVNAVTTADVAPTISGTAVMTSGDSLTVSVNGATYSVAVAEGRWTLDLATAVPVSGTPGALQAGQVYSVTATVIDDAGNSVADLTTGELSIAPPPPEPVATSPEVVLRNRESQPTLTSSEIIGVGTVSDTAATEMEIASPVVSFVTFPEVRIPQVEIDTGTRALYTRADGFQVIVLKSETSTSSGGERADASKAALLVNRGIPDMEFDYAGREIEVAIPRDAFAHSRNDALISLTILQLDGSPLPKWLTFDPRLGILRGVPPEGTQEELVVRAIARDQFGNQVEVTFRIKIHDASGAESGMRGIHPGLSKQLLAAGKGERAREHDRLLRWARVHSAQRSAARG